MKEFRQIKSRYEFSLDNRQAVLIVSGLILMLMLSFIMGTLFGRNLARMSEPEQAAAVEAPGGGELSKAVLAAEEVAVKDEAPGRTAVSDKESSRESLIRRLESMKVPDRIEPGDLEKDQKAPGEDAPPMASLDRSAGDGTVSSGKDPAASPEKPGPQKSEPDKSERVIIPPGSYTIQLASLPDKADAKALVNELSKKRYDVYMLQVSLPHKGTFYRVRVGHYEDLDQARKALKILQSREGKYYDAWITQ